MHLTESSTTPGSATFHPGSICNLACVTCSSGASTRWAHELGEKIEAGNPKEISTELIVQAKKMKGVVICGGEPMLNFSSQTLLNNLDSDQSVRIHFNGTVMPKLEFLQESKRFQQIQYCFSIDGVEERFEYLRWPAKWNTVVDNITWLVKTAPDNIEFSVNITVSQLNKNYYHEVVHWAQHVMPRPASNKEPVVTFNHAFDNLTQKYLDMLDSRRNMDWRKLFPLAVEHIAN
jgi:MoaA/NifB/PqqE/SkfB family radical SAM enzyme